MAAALSALILRLATAAAALAMTLVLARCLGAAEFGRFAAMSALASLVSTAAALGQNVTVLRAGSTRGSRAAVLRATGTALTAALVSSLALMLLAAAVRASGQAGLAAVLAGAAALSLPLTLAELTLAAAQARGRLWLALAPRDVVWRLALAVVALTSAGRWRPDALSVALAAAALLMGTVVVQARITSAVPLSRILRPRWSPDAGARGRALAALSGMLAANLSVLVLGAILGPAAAGGFFAAQRIAQIAALPLYAARSALAAPVAANHAAGDRAALTRTLARGSRAAIAPTLLLALATILAADPLLRLFGIAPDQFRLTLIMLTAAIAFHALSGPTGLVLMLCGGHHALLRQTLLAEGAALTLIPVCVALAGPAGAAAALMAGTVLGNFAAISWARRHLGVDPGLGALLSPPGPPGGQQATAPRGNDATAPARCRTPDRWPVRVCERTSVRQRRASNGPAPSQFDGDP